MSHGRIHFNSCQVSHKCQQWHDLNFIIYFSIYFKIARVFRENMAKLAQVKKGSEWNTLCNTGGEKAYLAKEF